ncbi:hypothetical protein AWB67_04673 [Caballeronia terrestris]|uniref:Major facilitator transporter n=1 Tax=Caballeronia terrestris TaxID=1226301 RepID=A0A158K367_9BURK|nr:hypothetical protein [Caballeronia terrestris]SAL74921.1 hypothetical protein AWB67_04673 [Caballeronia terrestris]
MLLLVGLEHDADGAACLDDAASRRILVGRLSDHYLKKRGVGTGRRRNAVALPMLAGSAILAVPFPSNLTVLLVVFSVTLTGIASTTSLNLVVGGNVFGMIAPIATG